MSQIPVQFILICLACFGICSCGKDPEPANFVVINGLLNDSKTGTPLVGATISYSLFEGNNSHGTYSLSSNSDGEFTIKHTSTELITGLEIRKDGYLTRFNLTGEGVKIIHQIDEKTDIEVKMYPLDALLRIIYNNSLPIEKAVYLQAQCHSLLEVYGSLPFVLTQPYPYMIAPNSIDTVDYQFPSDERIYLYWGASAFQSVTQAPFTDSLYLAQADTATYSIYF